MPTARFENGVLSCLADYSVEAESVGSAEYVVLKLVALGILSWPCTVVVLFSLAAAWSAGL